MAPRGRARHPTAVDAYALPIDRSPLRRVVGGLVFALLGIPAGTVAFLVLLAGWIFCPLLAFTPVLPVALVAYRALVGWTATADAWLARRLLGVDARPTTGSGGSRYWGRVNAVLGDGAFWRQQGYLAQRATLGFGLGVGVLAVVGTGVNAATAFAYYRATDVEIVAWDVDRLWQALVLVPAGLLVVALGLLLVVPLARLEGWLVTVLLDPPPPTAAARALNRRLLLLAHATVAAIAVAVCVIVWALTGAGGFWPVWPTLALGLTLAVHVWVERAVAAHDGSDGARLGLAIHAGVATAIELFLVGAWAVTGGPFWPAWSLLGLGIPVAVHLAVLLLHGARDTSVLGARVQHLQSTRAAAVGAQEEHLRRLERDLHDGAQARLVALGMSLGMAEQRLQEDPDGALALVAEAREGVGAALRELRDLARGLHPPVLADRGLEAAIVSLVDAGPLPVEVDVDLPGRPPVAVETAAYFVVAESIANAAKHADAAHVRVRVRYAGSGVVVEVEDDGRGGADPGGHGLTGLRGRIEALDGTLVVTSPAGGPTVVRAELPCAS